MLESLKHFVLLIIGTPGRGSTGSLDEVRRRGVKIFAYVFVMLMLAVGSVRFFMGFYQAAMIEYAAAILSLVIIILTSRGYFHLSTWIACGIGMILIIVLTIQQSISITNLFIALVFLIAIFILLFKSTRDSIILVICCICMAIWVSKMYGQPASETIPALFLLIVLSAAFLYVIKYIEMQDGKLTQNITQLNELNSNQEKLNNSLKLKNEDLQTFTHIMSHDLKAPLNTITSFSKLVSDEMKNDHSKIKEYLGYISTSAESMSDLIQDLLTYSKVETIELVNFQEVDLNELIGEITAKYQFEIVQNKLSFELNQLPTIHGNPDLLHTLFYNLISNSIKYQPKDNDFHIPLVSIKAEKNDQYNTIILSDNGIGIQPGYVENLFTPFKRFHNSSEYEGTGLGMSIVKKVISKHNGTIEVLETSDKGTSFKLIFPNNLSSTRPI